jgi:tetratricopeptide (TPR) repeat protein
VRAALETLVDGGADLTLGAKLCLALQRSWFLQGQVVDGVRWTERLLSRIELDPALRIKILFMRAVMARHQYDYREAIRRYRELLAFHRAAGDAKRVALTLIHLAGCLCTVGETDAAKTCALEGLDALAPDDSYFIGHAYVALGLAENYAGHVSEAEAAHREALARFVTSESAADVSVCLSNLATCALERDDLASAETYAAESIAQAEKARASVAIGASLCVLGNVAIARGDVAAACAHARAATNVARETNDHERLAEVFEVGVRIALAQADPASAARFFGVADALRARCFAVRARLEALAFDALADRLRDRLGASRLDALRVTGGTMAVPDALEALDDMLTGPHAISLAR